MNVPCSLRVCMRGCVYVCKRPLQTIYVCVCVCVCVCVRARVRACVQQMRTCAAAAFRTSWYFGAVHVHQHHHPVRPYNGQHGRRRGRRAVARQSTCAAACLLVLTLHSASCSPPPPFYGCGAGGTKGGGRGLGEGVHGAWVDRQG